MGNRRGCEEGACACCGGDAEGGRFPADDDGDDKGKVEKRAKWMS